MRTNAELKVSAVLKDCSDLKSEIEMSAKALEEANA